MKHIELEKKYFFENWFDREKWCTWFI